MKLSETATPINHPPRGADYAYLIAERDARPLPPEFTVKTAHAELIVMLDEKLITYIEYSAQLHMLGFWNTEYLSPPRGATATPMCL